ncbi:MAG: 3'-5' exonuclease, partial [Desulfosalsimonas sp.]
GSARQRTDLQEERRLFYVAMTRAMEELFLVSAKNRRIHGRSTQQKPSRFLADIPEELKKEIALDPPKKNQVQLTLFEE